ncbi:MAG TPA: hypothetical protein VN369_00095 [Terriglobales bacterium]|nr:hypothetical protein [Terriglobales bacterium]
MKAKLIFIVCGVLGAVGGYLYYRFVGCLTGTCVIAANPLTSTFFGAVFGVVIAGPLSELFKKISPPTKRPD